MAIRRDITADDDVFTGEDKVINGIVYQGNGVTPQDITGWALSCMVKKNATDPDANAKVTKTSGSGIAVVSATGGTYTITLTDTDLSIAAGAYAWEVKRTNDGNETVLTYGSFLLQQGVHR